MKLKISYIFICALYLISCTRDCPTCTLLNGKLTGYVVQRSQIGHNIPNPDSVLVSIIGADLNTYSNEIGYWTIDDISAGTYDIIFEKNGYDAYPMYGFQFVGGGEAFIPNYSILKLPSFTVTEFEIEVVDEVVFINGNISENIEGYVQPFIDLTNDISQHTGNLLELYPSGYVNPGYFSFRYSKNDFMDSGIESGTKCYIILFPINRYSWNRPYINKLTGQHTYVGINPVPSEIDSFLVP